jgi:hypothetical protein
LPHLPEMHSRDIAGGTKTMVKSGAQNQPRDTSHYVKYYR